MTTQEKIEVMKAHVEGKEIESILYGMAVMSSQEKWTSDSNPSWDWGRKSYRVKPREPRRIWLEEYKNGCTYVNFLKESASGIGKLTEFVEVIK